MQPLIEIARRVEKITMLGSEELAAIMRLCVEAPTGDIVCAGVAHGGDIIGIHRALEQAGIKRNIVAIDSFRGHSAPQPQDSREGKPGHPEQGVHNVGGVQHFYNWLAKYGIAEDEIETYELFITDETIKAIPHRPVAILWIDVNLYEPTLATLKYFWPDVVTGGWVIVDDYEFGVCHGIKPAIDDSEITGWNLLSVRHRASKAQKLIAAKK